GIVKPEAAGGRNGIGGGGEDGVVEGAGAADLEQAVGDAEEAEGAATLDREGAGAGGEVEYRRDVRALVQGDAAARLQVGAAVAGPGSAGSAREGDTGLGSVGITTEVD